MDRGFCAELFTAALPRWPLSAPVRKLSTLILRYCKTKPVVPESAHVSATGPATSGPGAVMTFRPPGVEDCDRRSNNGEKEWYPATLSLKRQR